MKKSKFNYFVCLLILASLLICTAFTSAQDGTLQPRYTNIRSLTASLEISKSGCASCYGKVMLTKSTDTADLTMELQRSSDGINIADFTWKCRISDIFMPIKQWQLPRCRSPPFLNLPNKIQKIIGGFPNGIQLCKGENGI